MIERRGSRVEEPTLGGRVDPRLPDQKPMLEVIQAPIAGNVLRRVLIQLGWGTVGYALVEKVGYIGVHLRGVPLLLAIKVGEVFRSSPRTSWLRVDESTFETSWKLFQDTRGVNLTHPHLLF